MLFWAHIGLAGSFGALLVDLFVVAARGLYLARHLFTLYSIYSIFDPKEFNDPRYSMI